jgi:C-terminal processing protease CtpA/Prc
MNAMMRKIQFVICCLIGTVLSQSAVAQRGEVFRPDSVFVGDTLRADIDSLSNAIMASHPNPYAFCTKEDFYLASVRAKSEIGDSCTLARFTSIVGRFLQVMKDSHTCPDYGHLQRMQVNHDGYLLPLNVYSVGDEHFVDIGRTNELPRGSKLLSINGRSMDELLRQADDYSCIEGTAEVGRERVRDAVFPSVVGLFSEVCDTNTIELLEPGTNAVKNMVMLGLDEEAWIARQRKASKLEFDSLFHLSFGNSNEMALLKIGTFAPSNGNTYRRFVKHAFKRIKEKQCDNLIIDLRDNGGGSSGWVEYLYSFLDSTGHNTPSNIIGKASKLARSRGSLSKPAARWMIRKFYKRDENVSAFLKLYELEDGKLDTFYFEQRTKQRKRFVFPGNCYLIINGLTASASVDFTNTFKQNQRGVVVGEPCLGPIRGTFGNPTLYMLPHSHMKISMSTIRYNYDNTFQYDPEPIMPDYVVPTKVSDLALPGSKHRDTQLEFIEALIFKNKKP